MSTRRGMGSKVGVSDEETWGRVQVGRGTNIPSASPNVMKAADIYEEKRLDHISVYPSQSSLYYLDVPPCTTWTSLLVCEDVRNEQKSLLMLPFSSLCAADRRCARSPVGRDPGATTSSGVQLDLP
jgi:hypothetical protein